jgi:hypothetical protein
MLVQVLSINTSTARFDILYPMPTTMKHNLNPNSLGLRLAGLKAMVKFTGMTRLGLVLMAFGLPVSGEWLAAALPCVTWKNRAKLGIDSMSVWSENQSSLG